MFMNEWRFLPLEVKNGFWNMALDEAILTSVIEKRSPNTLRFYKWDPSTVSIGRNQSLSNEVNIDFAKKKDFNVVRRITGGGAVFHDKEREITYSIVCAIKYLESLGALNIIDQFEIITKCIIIGLRFYGLKTETGVIHCPALFLNGKKFSGNAQVRRRGFILQHGTILLDLDPNLMYSVLKAPNNVSKSRMIRSVYTKCIGIKESLTNFDEELFISALTEGFKKTLQMKLTEGVFSSYEIELAKGFINSKYSNEEWLGKYE
jgi:lipoate-protein ligase A